MSLFRCPICRAPLLRGDRAYTCPTGHSYDIAKEGYVHLLPANQMHSKAPGDDKTMATARTRFLSKGYYETLCSSLCKLANTYTEARPRLLDSGCGEGYYTAGIYEALLAAGKLPRVAGIDLSKPSLRQAAKRAGAVEWSVASAYHLPVADGAIDLLVNCFSPLALEEFLRVLRPGGVLLYVVPAGNHLWQLKEVLYENPYPNPETETPYQGFEYLEICPVDALMHIASAADLADLFRMTPYCWKTPKAGADRLAALACLDVTAAFRIHVFRKKAPPVL